MHIDCLHPGRVLTQVILTTRFPPFCQLLQLFAFHFVFSTCVDQARGYTEVGQTYARMPNAEPWWTVECILA